MSVDPERDGTIPAEDVDDVVGVASELEQAAEHRVRVEEMKEIAEDLRIDPKYVEPAIATLERRREHERARDAESARSRRTMLVRVAMVLGAVTAVVLGGALLTRSSLAPRWALVEQQRAQVASVIERRERVEAIWAGQPPGLDRDAELAGAENRVGIERRRYDEAAAEYNASASGVPHAMLCGVAGVPCRAPLSSEIEAW